MADILLVGWDDVAAAEAKPIFCPRLTAFRAEAFEVQGFSHPVCSQSRQAILFGSYGKKIGTWQDIGTQEFVPGLTPPITLPTLPGVLQGAGYATSLVGKWHCGPCPDGQHWALAPIQRGYSAWQAGTRLNLSNGYNNWQRVDAWSNGVFSVQESVQQYTTLAQLDAATNWWATWSGVKRFMHVCFNAPHAPFHVPPEELLAGYPAPDLGSTNRQLYHAMLRSADTAFGRLLDLVGPNTVVFLYSDNGTAGGVAMAGVDPTHGKETTFDPGVRVLILGRWKGCPIGSFPRLNHLVDIPAGICAAAGVTPPVEWDSSTAARTAVLLEAQISSGAIERACRTSSRKLRQSTPLGGTMVEELYDVIFDPGETTPLDLNASAEQPALNWLRARLAEASL